MLTTNYHCVDRLRMCVGEGLGEGHIHGHVHKALWLSHGA